MGPHPYHDGVSYAKDPAGASVGHMLRKLDRKIDRMERRMDRMEERMEQLKNVHWNDI